MRRKKEEGNNFARLVCGFLGMIALGVGVMFFVEYFSV